MSEQEAKDKGLRLIPVWLPIVMAVVTTLCSAGAAYATYGWRMTDAERRLANIESNRIERIRDVAEMKADIRWIRNALEKR